jgi:transketolase
MKPDDPNRDFLILSKGHGVMAQYACMKELGWLKDSDLINYFADGTKLKGLSDSRVRGLEVTSGSLGHGLSVGVGIALGNKISQTAQKTFIIVGDGELNEGSCWEAIQFAGHHALSNICMIVDKNNFQAMDKTSNIINQQNLVTQIEAFNFNVTEVDGHNECALDNAINDLFSLQNNKPSCIVANTIKGKGVSFMENKNDWHYLRLDKSLYEQALLELE